MLRLLYRIVTDDLGSVRVVAKSDGTVKQRIDYDEWGVPTYTPNTVAGWTFQVASSRVVFEQPGTS